MGSTILLADKSITIQKIVQLTFSDDNFNIQTVGDGQAALDMIPQVRPDLVLADISLPGKSGYEICRTLRNDPQFGDFSTIPVILLAGIYETMDEERTRQVEERVKEVGANDFLSKPFDPQLLISKVKQYLSVDSTKQEGAGSSVFTPEPDTGINLFETESPQKPPEDLEKTMMLPGGPFGSMFATEPTPYEEEEPGTPRQPLDIDALKPVNEVVFEEENFPAVELGSEQEEENLLSQSTLKIEPGAMENERFGGRQEPEFEYKSGPVLNTSQGAEPAGSIPLILPNAEDPFGDVFQEPETVQWSGSASEEDSPFGVPEPPPAPEVQETASGMEFQEEPAILTEAEQAGPVETFDDTWPGMPVRSNVAPQVEELFETEASLTSLSEDAEELEPDMSERSEQEESLPATAAAQQSTVVSSAGISEELIDRIAERVLNKLSERVVSEIVWQVVPDLAEKMIRRELEKLHAADD